MVVFACVLVLHAGLVLGLRLAGRHPPACLDFPRLELFLGLFMINPVAQAAARKSLPPPPLLLCMTAASPAKPPIFAALLWVFFVLGSGQRQILTSCSHLSTIIINNCTMLYSVRAVLRCTAISIDLVLSLPGQSIKCHQK